MSVCVSRKALSILFYDVKRQLTALSYQFTFRKIFSFPTLNYQSLLSKALDIPSFVFPIVCQASLIQQCMSPKGLVGRICCKWQSSQRQHGLVRLYLTILLCAAALLTVSEEVRSRCSLKHRKSLLISDLSMDPVPMDYSSHITDPSCRWGSRDVEMGRSRIPSLLLWK